MRELPVLGLSPQEQAERMRQLSLCMGKQVKSYWKARHMGESSSVPLELAQELMESVEYTLNQVGGMEGNPNIWEGLEKGQKILEEKHSQGEQLLRLVEATAPVWQGECRWDTVRTLGRYIDSYDWKHLAHRLPENAEYPLIVPVPEHLRGIDHGLFFLRMLWLENQIMDAFPEEELDRFWSVFCQHDRGLTENQCEGLLVNAIGKALISGDVRAPVFSDGDWDAAQKLLSRQSDDAMETAVSTAAFQVAAALKLRDPNAVSYVGKVGPNLLPRLKGAVGSNRLTAIFL